MTGLEERAAIVAWLRRRTNLYALAALLEAGIHGRPDKEQDDYAARNELGRLRNGSGGSK